MQENLRLQAGYLPISVKNLKNDLKKIFKDYLLLLSDKTMVTYICILGFMACVLVTYTIAAPIIYIKHLHVEKKIYGFHQGSVWAIFGLFCFLNHHFIKYTNLLFTKKLGFALIIAGCLLLNITAHFYTIPILITFSMMLYSAGSGLLITILFADAMSLHINLRGASSSIITLFRNLFIAITAAIVGYFFNGTILPLTYIISILVTLVILLYKLIVIKELNLPVKHGLKRSMIMV